MPDPARTFRGSSTVSSDEAGSSLIKAVDPRLAETVPDDGDA
jgi:hypothetical protein